MDAKWQTVADELEIRKVLATYSRGVDRMDRALLASIYWPDAYDHHGSFQGPAMEFVDWVLEHVARERCTMHLLGQSYIDIHGDKANTETYWTAYHVRDAEDLNMVLAYAGRYVDQFEKRGGVWKIRHRDVIRDFAYKQCAEPPLLGGKRKIGAHSTKDPSYDVFGPTT